MRLEQLTELNVIAQMENLHTHPAVQQRVEAGRLGIHGWIYDIPTGVVQAWDSAAACFAPWPELPHAGTLRLVTCSSIR